MKRRANGQGCIYQRKGGGWCAELHMGTVDGKPRRITLYRKTREEVERELEAVKAQLTPTIRHGRTTVAAFLHRWLNDSVALRNKPRTVDGYRKIVNNYIIPRIGKIPLKILAPAHVQKMIGDLAETLAPNTVRNVRACLRCALNFAMRLDLVTRNVARYVDMPRIEKHKITPLNPKQARALLAAMAGDRLEAVYHIALHLGLRRAEIMGLQWPHIDFDNMTMEVSGSLQRVKGKLTRVSTKTGNTRILPLPPTLAQVLKAHQKRQQAKKHDSEYVFTTTVNTPLDPCFITRHIKEVLQRANLPLTFRFHDLRHTSATFLINQDVHLRVVMEILGHTSITTTADIYGHVLPEASRTAISKLDALLSEGKE